MPRPSPYVRPFGPKAPWNIPVAGLKKHPESSTYSSRFYNYSPDRAGNFNISKDYTYPVYYASDATTTVKVNGGQSSINGKTIPWNPNWKSAGGSDGQIIILDEEKGIEYDMWQVKLSGSTLNISNGSVVPGNYHTYEGGNPPSRGVGIQYLAMLVRPEEIASGVINHALSVPISNPSKTFYVAPATKLEHPGSEISNPIPEGMRFALNITDAEISSWANSKPSSYRQFCRVMATAMRDYGWFITDTSGGAHFQIEAAESADSLWKSLGVDMSSTTLRDILDGLITQNRIYAIVPSDQYGNIEPPVVNTAPVVNLSGPANIKVGEVATFTAKVTDDGLPNGTLKFDWKANSSSVGIEGYDTKIASVVVTEPGTYTLTFSANDGELTTTKTLTFSAESSQPPVDCSAIEAELVQCKAQLVQCNQQIAVLQAQNANIQKELDVLKNNYSKLDSRYTGLRNDIQSALNNN